MLHITTLENGLDVFKALGSDIRLQIINLLLNRGSMNMNELANQVRISNGALTSHIRKLENSGIVTISNESANHGNEKICSVQLDKILVDLSPVIETQNVFHTSIKIGQYANCSVQPNCGLASSDRIIGEVDDSRYFAHSDHLGADVLWFTKGSIEYQIPNFIPNAQKITHLTISAELSAQAPENTDLSPSEIHFYLNETFLGSWTIPTDIGSAPGMFTPDWWYPNWNQHGLLKLLVINSDGTYMDGLQISDVTIQQLNLDFRSSLRFKMAVDESNAQPAGLTIFGKTFGNYSQDINVSIGYSSI